MHLKFCSELRVAGCGALGGAVESEVGGSAETVEPISTLVTCCAERTNPPGANARLLTYCLTATSPIHTHPSASIDDRPKHSSTWPPCAPMLIWG